MQTLASSSVSRPSVYVAWQDPATREWHTVARLTQLDKVYEFGFTRGAENLRDVAKQLFNSNLNDQYLSDGLTSLFRNKIPPRSRSDFLKMADWLNLKGSESDFELLGKFGLIPGTDGLLIYPSPRVLDGQYSIEFFIHGIRHAHGDHDDRHLHGDVLGWCKGAQSGDRLYPLLDVQNEFDPNAIALRANDSTISVGYVPRFYARDLRTILAEPDLAHNARIQIVRNNADAPLQFRMLCRFSSNVPQNFEPLADADHQLLEKVLPDRWPMKKRPA